MKHTIVTTGQAFANINETPARYVAPSELGIAFAA